MSRGSDGNSRAFALGPILLGLLCGLAICSTAVANVQLELISDPQGANASFSDAGYVGPRSGNTSFYYGTFPTPLGDGSHAFFSTTEPLVAADRDTGADLYDYSSAGVELVTTGPSAGSFGPPYCPNPTLEYGSCKFASSSDGKHVFFATEQSLVPEDTDTYSDLYERFDGTTRLVSIGPSGGNGPYDVCEPNLSPCRSFAISVDGSRVFFETAESLVPDDTDGGCGFGAGRPCIDVYERSNGVTRLVSTGPAGGNGSYDACAIGKSPAIECSPIFSFPYTVSVDGAHVFFATSERLVAGDTDDVADVYERTGGETKLVSTGPAGGNGAFPVSWRGAAADGSRVFFATAESLVAADTDGQNDLYVRDANGTALVEIGQAARHLNPSYDGSRYFFGTRERLSAADTDDRWDLYAWHGGDVELISTGPDGGNGPFDVCDEVYNPCLEAASRDGTRVFFSTREPLIQSDTDMQCPIYVGEPYPCPDIYERSNGVTRLVSTGPTGDGAGVQFEVMHVDSVSADGSRVFFSTHAALVPEDTDGDRGDIYARVGERTLLLSPGPSGRTSEIAPRFGGASAEGSVAYFTTEQALLPEDADTCGVPEFAHGCMDVYAARIGPDCARVVAQPNALRPPNKRFALVTLSAGSQDGVSITIRSVTQDEPVQGRGDTTTPDARSGPTQDSVFLRRERSRRGDGRVYRISFDAIDPDGSCSGVARATVPLRASVEAIDSAPPSYDSFAG
jgi:hypothetical protein